MITINEALRASYLEGVVTKQAVSYKVGKLKEAYLAAQREGRIICIPDELEEEEGGTKISPLTDPASSSSRSSTRDGGGGCSNQLCSNCKSNGVVPSAADTAAGGGITTTTVRSIASTRRSQTRRSSRQADVHV